MSAHHHLYLYLEPRACMGLVKVSDGRFQLALFGALCALYLHLFVSSSGLSSWGLDESCLGIQIVKVVVSVRDTVDELQ